MNRNELKEKLAPHFAKRNVAHRLPSAERAALHALGWLENAKEEVDAIPDNVYALALLYPIADLVLPSHRVRTGIEAFFVSHGWTETRIRQVLRGADRLPDKPKSVEEKLVADADLVTRLGLFGLVRHVADGAAQGHEFDAIFDEAQRNLYRRAYTAPGQTEIVALKKKMRELLMELRTILESPSASG